MIALEQQVNLFQPIFRAERKLFATPFIGASLALLVVVLVLLWGFAWRQVVELERNVEAVETARLERHNAMRRMGAGLASDPAIVMARSRQLAAEVERAERSLVLIRSGSVGTTTGFSARLQGLAKPDMQGLWLTRIAFAGHQAALAGLAQDAAAIPRYLQALVADEAFAGLRVDSFQADRREGEAGGVAERIEFVAGNSELLATRDDRESAPRTGVAR